MRASADIQADLDAARASMASALQAQEYTINTGQGSQAVKRVDFDKLAKWINRLEIELENVLAAEGGDLGLVSGQFRRYQ